MKQQTRGSVIARALLAVGMATAICVGVQTVRPEPARAVVIPPAVPASLAADPIVWPAGLLAASAVASYWVTWQVLDWAFNSGGNGSVHLGAGSSNVGLWNVFKWPVRGLETTVLDQYSIEFARMTSGSTNYSQYSNIEWCFGGTDCESQTGVYGNWGITCCNVETRTAPKQAAHVGKELSSVKVTIYGNGVTPVVVIRWLNKAVMMTTVRCVNAAGGVRDVTVYSAEFRPGDEDPPPSPMVNCADELVGGHVDGAAGSLIDATLPRPASNMTLPNPGQPLVPPNQNVIPIYRTEVTKQIVKEPGSQYADCWSGAGCKLTLYQGTGVTAKECLQTSTDCAYWPARAAAGEPFECRWGSHVMPLGDCDPYRDEFRVTSPNPQPTPTGSPGPAPGGPGGGPGDDPVVRDPNGPPRPPPVADSTGGECFPHGWGVLNPVEWVYKPVRCALVWAFVPPDGTWEEIGGSVTGAWDSSVTGAWMTMFGDTITGMGALVRSGGGCEGPTIALPQLMIEAQPLNACEQPMKGVAEVVNLGLGISVILAAIVSCVHLMASAFGMRLPWVPAPPPEQLTLF